MPSSFTPLLRSWELAAFNHSYSSLRKHHWDYLHGHLCWLVVPVSSNTENDRVREWLRLKGPLEVIWSNCLLKQSHLELVVQDLVQMAFEYLQEWTLHNFSGNLYQCQSPLLQKCVSWCWRWTFHVSVCAHCLWSCHWAPLKRAWFCPLCTLPWSIDTHRLHIPWAFSSPSWAVPALSAFPYRGGAPVPSSSLWHFVGLFPVCPCLSCSEESSTGHSTPGVASPVLRGRILSHDLLPILCLMQPRMPFAAFVARAQY